MTRLRAILAGLDLSDAALVAGTVLLWVGLGMIAAPLPFVVVGVLLLAFGALPAVVAMSRRRR